MPCTKVFRNPAISIPLIAPVLFVVNLTILTNLPRFKYDTLKHALGRSLDFLFPTSLVVGVYFIVRGVYFCVVPTNPPQDEDDLADIEM